MSTLFKDVRYALRTLAKSPGFTAVALITLAVGIGANTVTFSVVDAVLFKVLPYPHPQRLVALVENEHMAGDVTASWPDFLDWQKQNQVFDSIALYNINGMNLTGLDQPQRVEVMRATAPFWDLTGARPALGRVFSAGDDRVGASPTVVLSYAFWQTRFGADPNIVGRTLTLDQASYRITGVLPASFWVPYGADIFVRLTPITNDSGWLDRLVGDVRGMLYLLLAAVGFVLLTACVNVRRLMADSCRLIPRGFL